MATANLSQDHYGFFQDDNADPDSCSQIGVDDTGQDITMDTNVMVRISIGNDSTANANTSWSLQYQVNSTAGTWNEVTTSSSNARVATGTPTDGASCDTQLLTSGTGSFDTVGLYDDGDGDTASIAQNKSEFMECQWCVTLRSADLTATDVVYFRAVPSSGNMSYNIYPAATAVAASLNDYTLTADVDANSAFSVTGTDANLERHTVVAADAGSYSVTDPVDTVLELGVPATAGAFTVDAPVETLLTYTENATSYTLPAEAGAFTVTGTDANPEAHRVVGAETTSYAVTGTDANVERHTVVVADAGTYSVATPVETQLTVVGDYTIIAEAGAFTVTDPVDTVLELGVPADVGAFSVFGTDANLERHTAITAETVAFSVATPVETVLTYTENTTAYDIIAETAAFDVTGTDANLERHGVVAADAVAFDVTGTDANVEWHRLIAADTVAVDVTGTDAGLERHALVAADTVAFDVTGTDVAFQRSYVLAADAGTYAFTGADAGLLVPNPVMVAESGAFTVTDPVDAILRHVVPATAGAFDITGADIDTLRNVPGDTGVFSVTAPDETVLTYSQTGNYNVVADAAAFDVTGTDANLEVHRVVTADGSSYTLTGQNAALVRSLQIAADAASYSVATPAETGLTYQTNPGTFVMPANDTAYSVSGTDVTLTTDRVMTADAGVFAWNGNAASLGNAFAMTAGPGVFSFAGRQVAFLRDYAVQSAAGAYSVASPGATLRIGDLPIPDDVVSANPRHTYAVALPLADATDANPKRRTAEART